MCMREATFVKSTPPVHYFCAITSVPLRHVAREYLIFFPDDVHPLFSLNGSCGSYLLFTRH